MKSFLHFIAEVKSLNTTSKKSGMSMMSNAAYVRKRFRFNSEKEGYGRRGIEYKHVSTTKSGHHVYHSQTGKVHEFHFHDPHEYGKIDVAVASTLHGKHKNGTETHRIDGLASREGSTLKAHDAYHHLIKHHGLILKTDTQTPGSQAVWRKLAKKRDLNVHGWHKGKPVNVTPGEEDHEDIYHDAGTPSEGRPKELIAHKR